MTSERPDLPISDAATVVAAARDAREAEVRARSAVFPVDCIGIRSAPHAPVSVGEIGVTNLGEAYTSARLTTYTPTGANLESYSVTRLPACPICGREPRVTDEGVLEVLRETYRQGRKSVTVSQIDAVMARRADGHS